MATTKRQRFVWSHISVRHISERAQGLINALGPVDVAHALMFTAVGMCRYFDLDEKQVFENAVETWEHADPIKRAEEATGPVIEDLVRKTENG